MMEDFSYENSLEWVPREYPIIEYPSPQQPAGQRFPASPQPQRRQQFQQPAAQQLHRVRPQPTAHEKPMTKNEALGLLESLKRSILVGALLGFAVLSGLAATH